MNASSRIAFEWQLNAVTTMTDLIVTHVGDSCRRLMLTKIAGVAQLCQADREGTAAEMTDQQEAEELEKEELH